MVKKSSPDSKLFINCIKAFATGGLICAIAQVFNNYLEALGFNKDDTGTIVAVTFIFIAAVLTGLGIYDKLGQFSGAGSLVPITGFSNSVAAPALEFKKEGFIFGVAYSNQFFNHKQAATQFAAQITGYTNKKEGCANSNTKHISKQLNIKTIGNMSIGK